MLRYKILDIFVKKNNNISLETFNCFISAIKKNLNIEIALICSMDAEESEHNRMNKLIKPKQIDEIIRSGVVLKSRKEYLKLPQVNTVDDLKTICGVRVKK